MEDYIERLPAIAQSLDPYPVDFDDAWQWVGYARKDYALDALKANFEEGIDFCSGLNRSKQGRGGHNQILYFLTTDCFKAFCMMAGTEKGKEVRRYYLDIEKRYYSQKQHPRLDYRLVEALNESVRLGAITSEQFRVLLGIPAEQATPVRLPYPCHDLPDFTQPREKKIPLISGPEAWYPPIPIVQAFIDECCIRGVGGMTHLEVDPVLFSWQKTKNLESFISVWQFFKYLGLMGYDTSKKNRIYSVNGLTLDREGL